MTVVVAITDGERLVFGADSAATNLETGEIYTLANEKIFRIGPWLVGHTASYHLGQVLRFRVAWPTELPAKEKLDEFIAVQVVDAVRIAFEAAGIAIPSQATAGTTFLVGVMNRIFAISHDLSVAYLYHPFAAIGHGRFVAYGALYTQRRSKAPLELRCRRALEAAAQFDSTVRGPYTFLSSTTANKA